MDIDEEAESSPSQLRPQNHEEGAPGATNDTTAKPLATRRRAACQSCRKRKVRCDNARPTCGFCQHNGIECAYIERGDYTKEDRDLGEVIERLDTLSHAVENIQSFLFSNGTPTSSGNSAPQQLGRQFDVPLEDGEPYKDYLQIPSCRGSADTVLTWPIYLGRFRESSLITTLFQSSHGTENSAMETWVMPGGFRPTNEERIPALVDQFVQNVHTKNPILDLGALVCLGRQAAEFGLQWDSQSCLVLLACALGCISRPFTASMKVPLDDGPVPQASVPKSTSASGLKEGETFFVMACRRIGLLRYSVLGAQCHFFAGVYLMYTFRPLAAWNHFYQASTFYRLRLRMIDGLSIDDDLSADEPVQRGTSVSRHMEQSLYWSCFKSEVEIRVELPLPQSAIAEYEYPALFPTPPNLSDDYPEGGSHGTGWSTSWNSSISADDHHVNQAQTPFEVRNHIMQLFDEEQSWYYYLTEVALRRIGNRVLNAFYRKGPSIWSNIKPLIPLALEFESQINAWSANLPPAMRYYEDNASPGQARNSSPDRQDSISLELSWAIANRLLEIRLWLYQPFLYFAIHHPIISGRGLRETRNSSFTGEELATISTLVKSGLNCTLKILEARCLRHRHHGIWFDLRALVTSSLIVIAAVKSGNLDVPGIDGRVGLKSHFDGTLEALTYWEDEAPDIKKARRILEDILTEAG
ncbi:putative C6 transcription factor [Lipomyces tetrasporus]